MWAQTAPRPIVLNYMLILRGDDVLCLTTTDEPPAPSWAEEMADTLADLFPGKRPAVRAVEQLPPLASLGQYLAGSCPACWTWTRSATGTGFPPRSRTSSEKPLPSWLVRRLWNQRTRLNIGVRCRSGSKDAWRKP